MGSALFFDNNYSLEKIELTPFFRQSRSVKLKAIVAAMALFCLSGRAISAEALAPSSKVEDEGTKASRAEKQLFDLMPRRAPTASEILATVRKLINNGLTPGESFRYEVMDSDVSLEVYGLYIPQEEGSLFEGLSDKERQKINKKFPPVTKNGPRPFFLVRERSKAGEPLSYLVLYPTPSGMDFIKSRRYTHSPSNLSRELEGTCLRLNPIRKERRFDERIFNQLISYSAGYRFRKNYFVNKNVLGAFIETLAQLKVEAGEKVRPLNESNLERALTGFGYPVNYISSHYKLYTHYQQLGLDIRTRYQRLLGRSTGELAAFIKLMKELEAKDKFRLLDEERHLEGVLTGFGYPVEGIGRAYEKLKRAEHIRTIEESVAYLLSQKQEMVGLDLHTVGLFKDYLSQPATFEPLYRTLHSIKTNEELAKCIIALEIGKDGSLRDALLVELIGRNEKFIRGKANSMIRRFSLSDSLLEDLVQEGGMAFITYIDRYDPTRGKVLSYLGFWIEQEMRRSLFSEIMPVTLPQHVVEEIGILSRVRRELEASMDREPSLEKLLEALKERHPNIEWTQEEVLRLQALAGREIITLDMPLGEDEGEDYHRIIEDSATPSPLDEAIEAEDKRRIKAFVDSLPNLRQRLILDLRFGFTMDEMALEQVGEIFGITRERVRQEEGKVLSRLKAWMQGGVIRRREIGEEEKMMKFSSLTRNRQRNRRDFLHERFVQKTGNQMPYFGLLEQPEELLRYKIRLIQELFGDLGIGPC